jgi:hypothetical protein
MTQPSVQGTFARICPVGRGKAARPGLPERFQAKRKPVRVKKTRQIRNLEPRFDSIERKRLQAHRASWPLTRSYVWYGQSIGECFNRRLIISLRN